MKITIDIMDDEVCVTEWDENEMAISSKWGEINPAVNDCVLTIINLIDLQNIYNSRQEADNVDHQEN